MDSIKKYFFSEIFKTSICFIGCLFIIFSIILLAGHSAKKRDSTRIEKTIALYITYDKENISLSTIQKYINFVSFCKKINIPDYLIPSLEEFERHILNENN